jgi:hypothetical protein
VPTRILSAVEVVSVADGITRPARGYGRRVLAVQSHMAYVMILHVEDHDLIRLLKKLDLLK